MSSGFVVHGCKGAGSVIAEAFLTLGEIPFTHEEVNYDLPGPARDKLLALNPLCQVPTIVMPSGKVLTETLAVAAIVQAKNPAAQLIPKASPELETFWRWAVFIVAAIYPTYTYGDEPTKWVAIEEGARELKVSTDQHREKLFRQINEAASAPYFLGEKSSAIDVYLSVMSRWRPKREWHKKECPKIYAIATRIDDEPKLKALWDLNFPKSQ